MPYFDGADGNRTSGDQPLIVILQIGPDLTLGVSRRSIYRNAVGTDRYARSMQTSLGGIH